jgi:hypothetical protein
MSGLEQKYLRIHRLDQHLSVPSSLELQGLIIQHLQLIWNFDPSSFVKGSFFIDFPLSGFI